MPDPTRTPAEVIASVLGDLGSEHPDGPAALILAELSEAGHVIRGGAGGSDEWTALVDPSAVPDRVIFDPLAGIELPTPHPTTDPDTTALCTDCGCPLAAPTPVTDCRYRHAHGASQPDPDPEPFPSESAAVQAWIDGVEIVCRCGARLDRYNGQWLHTVGEDPYCPGGRSAWPNEAGPSIADSECGTCHRTWDSRVTPTPAARCPYEYDHEDDDENDDPYTVTDEECGADIAEAVRLIRLVLDADDAMADDTLRPLVDSDVVEPRGLLEAALEALGVDDA